MIVYTNSCLACTHKKSWKQLKDFAQKNKLTIDERRITFSKDWRREAKELSTAHNVSLPFIQYKGKVVELKDMDRLTEVKASSH